MLCFPESSELSRSLRRGGHWPPGSEILRFSETLGEFGAGLLYDYFQHRSVSVREMGLVAAYHHPATILKINFSNY